MKNLKLKEYLFLIESVLYFLQGILTGYLGFIRKDYVYLLFSVVFFLFLALHSLFFLLKRNMNT